MSLVWLPREFAVDELSPLPASLRLTQEPSPEELADVEVVVLADNLARFVEVLPQLRGLRLVQTFSAGVDWVPPLPDGVLLANGSGVHDSSVAEWVLAVVLAMVRRLPTLLDAQRAGTWDRTAHDENQLGGDLAGATVLIVGYGSIGRAVEARLAPFDVEVLRVARHARDEDGRPVAATDELPDLLGHADVVVLLAPATDETRGMVDRDFLARMRLGALLVNAGRGSLVDTDALLELLQVGRIRAALDVTDPEPLPDGHPLWSAPGCLITPHVAGSTRGWRTRVRRLLVDQLQRYADGRPLRNLRQRGY